MKFKFSRVPESIKQDVMAKFRTGNYTTVGLQNEYGVCKRLIKKWFEKSGEIDVYEAIIKNNCAKVRQSPISKAARLMISGNLSVSWKGKKIETRNGNVAAILIPCPNHPFARVGGYVAEHRLVMEKHLGRYLTECETVHHIDLDASNNNIENLMVLTHSQHAKLHHLYQVALVQILPKTELRELALHLAGMTSEKCVRKEIRRPVPSSLA